MKVNHLISVAIVAVAAVIFFLPPPAGASVHSMHAAALLLLAIGLWATAALPEHITALLFLALCMVLAIAPANVVFSGFESGTVWLVLGGLVIAEAVRSTGLGERIALVLFAHRNLTYPRLIAAACTVALLLAFLMPATVARVLLLLPIFAALGARMGLAPGSNGQHALALTAMIVSFQCGITVLPANAPNMVLAGAAETLYGKTITYVDYLFTQFPVMGLLKAMVIALMLIKLFPDKTTPPASDKPLKPMSPEEKRLAVVLVCALMLWATDTWHGLRPAWVALGAATILLLPRVGAVPAAMFPDRVKLGSFFYVGAVLGFGAVLQHSGVGRALGSTLLPLLHVQAGQDALNFFKLALFGTVAGLFTTNPALPALLAPLAAQMAEAAGWRLEAALMIIAVGFSTMVLPYQAPPVMVGVAVSGTPLRVLLRLTLPLTVVCIFVLLPMDFLWWWWRGYFR